MRIIILVIASRGIHFDSLAKIIRSYLNIHPNIKGYLIYDSDSKIEKKNDIIIYPEPCTFIPGILKKTIFAMDHIIKTEEFDYIFRTNLSSFFVLKRLIKYITTLPKNNCYCSEFHKPTSGLIKQLKRYGHKSNIKWGNGAGIILSKDVVKNIVRNKNKIDYRIIDDVSIGIYLSSLPNIKWIKQKRLSTLNYNSKHVIIQKNINNKIINFIKKNHFHYRHKDNNSNKSYIKIINRLYKKFY